MAKPCGPERLLFSIRLSNDATRGRFRRDPTLRLVSEIPPFEEFPQFRNPIGTLPPRLKTRTDIFDLSRFVNVLLVEGEYAFYI